MSESFSVSLSHVSTSGSTVTLKATFSSHGNYRGNVDYTVTAEPGPEMPDDITPSYGSVYVPKDRHVEVPILVTLAGTCTIIITAWDPITGHEDDLLVSTAKKMAPA